MGSEPLESPQEGHVPPTDIENDFASLEPKEKLINPDPDVKSDLRRK